MARGEGVEFSIAAIMPPYWTTPIGRLLTMAVFTAVLRNMPELSATGLNDLRHLRRINW